jgi:uncharacterized protein YehS (DUF1456 family)
MTNNDVLRRLRYMLKYSDQKLIELFMLAGHEVQLEDVQSWLKKIDDPLLVPIPDRELAIFLNGLIIEKRGKREGPMPEPEDPLSNNMILQKLKIALSLTSDDVLDLFNSINKSLSKHELSAFFRKPNHRSYRPCLDQYLRNFLGALHARLE